ncbi:MAG: serine O-acetyltransferase [Pseudomonadales bacterium]|nr:serine O-acetyltransferase [Pseudomonadales bacterium]
MTEIQKKAEDCEAFWQKIQEEALLAVKQDAVLHTLVHQVLAYETPVESLAAILANRLANEAFDASCLQDLFTQSLRHIPEIDCILSRDVEAVYLRDCACRYFLQPWLFFKGFHAIQTARIMHHLFHAGSVNLAYWLQNRASLVFGVDIHPASILGRGVMFDHATGIVIGETAVIDDDVSIMQAVTLGGTGKESGDRHPKIRRGALISVGAKILGNIVIGEGAMVSAGSVVLKEVAAHTTVAGIPAKPVGKPRQDKPALFMDHTLK